MDVYFKQRLAHSQMVLMAILIFSALSVVPGAQPNPALSATLLSGDQAAQVVTIRNLTIGVVSGELINKSARPLRDVQLLIRYVWLWNNEFHPGQDELGEAIYYTVEGEIPPGGSKPFTYRPASPLPSRTDGHFEVTVSVAGFTEILPQK